MHTMQISIVRRTFVCHADIHSSWADEQVPAQLVHPTWQAMRSAWLPKQDQPAKKDVSLTPATAVIAVAANASERKTMGSGRISSPFLHFAKSKAFS